MMEVTSGDYKIKEMDLTGDFDFTKETCLNDWSFDDLNDSIDLDISLNENIADSNDVDANSHQSFSDICDEFSKFLNDDDSKCTKETLLTDFKCTKETLLTDSKYTKETLLTDLNDLERTKEEKLTAFKTEIIRETDLTGGDEVWKLDRLSDENMKETQLKFCDHANSNVIKDVDVNKKEQTVPNTPDTENPFEEINKISMNNLAFAIDNTSTHNGDNMQYHYTSSENDEKNGNNKKYKNTKLQYNDGEYNNNGECKNDGQYNNGGEYNIDEVRFQDIESEFFETDVENNEQPVKSENKKIGSDQILFQDIESEFFETDCETTEKQRGYFQDIESDFFDDEEEDLGTEKNKKHSIDYLNKRDKDINLNNKDTSLDNKDISDHNKHTLNTNKSLNKTTTLSNTLLRSTIAELERALSDSNALLAKRDGKIQELRTRNIKLKKSFNKELEDNSLVKLSLIKKDALIGEKDIKIQELYADIKKANDELNDLRIYKLNNIRNSDILSDGEETIDDGYSSNIYTKINKMEKREHKNGSGEISKSNPVCRHKMQDDHLTSHVTKIKSGEFKRKCSHKNETINSIHHENSKCLAKQDLNKQMKDEKVTTNELHAHLRMKFMRDAFFYYMIGFHPDEQINAILAILEYGDKRQDFVLQAHQMRKLGKTFNVTKVSSRGFTFVQEQIK